MRNKDYGGELPLRWGTGEGSWFIIFPLPFFFLLLMPWRESSLFESLSSLSNLIWPLQMFMPLFGSCPINIKKKITEREIL